MINTHALWAKSPDKGYPYQPLLLHLLDTAAVVEEVLQREPKWLRDALNTTWGLPWVSVLAACHDLGKACPPFQSRWDNLLPQTGLEMPRYQTTEFVNHGYVSQVTVGDMLVQLSDWTENMADKAADAIGCHHGTRCPADTYMTLQDEDVLGDDGWRDARQQLYTVIVSLFHADTPPAPTTIDGVQFQLLAGTISFCDWIASNPYWFPPGTPADCDRPEEWLAIARARAIRALDGIGWTPHMPLLHNPKSFHQMFHLTPRPLQSAMIKVVDSLTAPSVILLEAPMGEGKTEAAFWSIAELQRRFGHRGCYIAMPTQATGTALYQRCLKFLRRVNTTSRIDCQLAHGQKRLDATYHRMLEAHSRVSSDGWYSPAKRTLLSRYAVGTVDQSLLSVLPVKHNFVRAWGLHNQTVVFDEVHSYDTYTGTLLLDNIRWLIAQKCSVIIMSATMTPAFRQELGKTLKSPMHVADCPYPRITVYTPLQPVRQVAFAPTSGRSVRIRVKGISTDLSALQQTLQNTTGYRLALLNTVQRAQDLYESYGPGRKIRYGRRRIIVGKILKDGTEIYLLHARYMSRDRAAREKKILKIFGPAGDNFRSGKNRILIATQVAEQSLDLDFDAIISDLAPMDLVLQRAGRLWRRNLPRATTAPTLYISGFGNAHPPQLNRPDLAWAFVYRESSLLRSWCVLSRTPVLTLPDDIDALIDQAYAPGFPVPADLIERFQAAADKDHQSLDYRALAHQSSIGLPDDGSWDDPSREYHNDTDTLPPRTRVGRPSVTVIPIYPADQYDPMQAPTDAQLQDWPSRAIQINRSRVIKQLPEIPATWAESNRLKHMVPLLMTEDGQSIDVTEIKLDPQTGLCYAKI